MNNTNCLNCYTFLMLNPKGHGYYCNNPVCNRFGLITVKYSNSLPTTALPAPQIKKEA